MPISSSLASGGGGSTTKADILLTLNLVTKGLKEADAVKKELAGVGKEAESAGTKARIGGLNLQSTGGILKLLGGTAAIASVGIAAVGKALEQSLVVGKAGAQYRQMTESFETLNEVVAPNVNILEQLGDASLHTTSKFEMMNAASVALAGLTGEFGTEMANALPQLLRIAKASEKLNPALGDTGFLFQSLTIGLKRLSPRLIDNTGLQIRLSEAYEKLANERGKAANELTSEEQQLALLNATLEAGDRLIMQAGGNVASYTDAYSEFSANVENAKNSLKGWFDEVIGQRIVSGLNDIAFGSRIVREQFELTARAVESSAFSYDAYLIRAANVALANDMITASQADIIKAFAEGEIELPSNVEQQVKDLIEDLGLLNEAIFNSGATTSGTSSAYAEYVNTITSVAVEAGQLTEEQKKLIIATQVDNIPMTEAMRKYGRSLVDASVYTEEGTKDLADYGDEILDIMHFIGMMTDAEFADARVKKDKQQVMKGYVAEMDKIYASVGLVTNAQKEQTAEELLSIKGKMSLSDALKLAKTDEDKIRIATEMFSVSLDANTIATLKNSQETLQNKLITGEMTEAEVQATEAELDRIAAILGVADAQENLIEKEEKATDAIRKQQEEIKKAADEARNAKTAFETMFDGLNRNLPSLSGGMLDDIEFLLAGGRDLQAQIELVGEAMRRELIAPDAAATVLEQLYIKSQALAISLGDTDKYSAAVAILDRMNVSYDELRAAAQADVLYNERIAELKKEGVDLTEERLEREREVAESQATINEKMAAAYLLLENIGDFDLLEALSGGMDKEAFLAQFSGLPDDIQALFTEVLGQTEFEASVTPVMEATALSDLYSGLIDRGMGEFPVNIPIPDDLLPFMDGGSFDKSAYVDVVVAGEQLDLVSWFFDGASAAQTASVAASFAPALSTEMSKLLGNENVTQTANVNVTDDISGDLSTLLLNQTLSRTVYVKVVSDGDDPTQKAVGGRVIAGQPYIVGEHRPELFVPDSAGRIMSSVPNYANSNGALSGITNINVSVSVASISNDLDLEVLSYQIARKISDRQRGNM